MGGGFDWCVNVRRSARASGGMWGYKRGYISAIWGYMPQIGGIFTPLSCWCAGATAPGQVNPLGAARETAGHRAANDPHQLRPGRTQHGGGGVRIAAGVPGCRARTRHSGQQYNPPRAPVQLATVRRRTHPRGGTPREYLGIPGGSPPGRRKPQKVGRQGTGCTSLFAVSFGGSFFFRGNSGNRPQKRA